MPEDVAFISSKSGVDTSRDGTLRFFKKNCFFKTKTCCVSTPDHMTAEEYSFNTSGCSVGEVFSKNRLHRGIQSAVHGELQRFKLFKKTLRVLQLWALHFEQVWRRSVEKRLSYVRAEKVPTDRRTDRRLFVFI